MSDMNTTENKVVFKSAVGGYNKKDVNEYILSENRRFLNIEQSYINTIEDLRRELDGAIAEIHRLSATAEALEGVSAKLYEAEAENTRLSEKVEELELEALASADLIAEKESKAAELTEALDKLREESEKEKEQLKMELGDELDDLKLELSTVKLDLEAANLELEAANIERDAASLALESVNIELEAAKADAANIKAEFAKLKEDEALRICAKNAQDEADSRAAKMAADELIARARIASEDVLRHAEEGAGVIIERARNEALSFRNEIFTAAKDMIATIAEELQRSVEMCMTNFVSSIKTARTDSRRTPGASSRSDDELGRRIERMQSDLDRAIADKLAEFDRKHGSFR